MTIDALVHKTGRSSKAAGASEFAIGELDANILDCPACRRPLDSGSNRCPGCGTRLLAGVRLSKGLMFLGVGVLLGAMVGGASVGLVAATTAPAAMPAPSAITSVPSAPPLASAPASLAPAHGIPASAVSAIGQTTLLNQRIATDAGRLAAALAVPEPSSAELARILRSLAGNAAVGERIAPVVGGWDRGAPLATALSRFYAAIGATAREGLGAALGNTSAYVGAASGMQAVLAELTALDAEARVLALAADVELPPLGATPTAP